MYACAIKEVRTKFDVLNTEFNIRYQRNPIQFISSRLKRTVSISEKLDKRAWVSLLKISTIFIHLQIRLSVRMMMTNIENGKVGMVITKDLSRFGATTYKA